MEQIRRSIYSIIIVCFSFLSPLTFAATINVPADQPTIQAGIDTAQNGDTVLVDDGIYKGEGNVNLDFKGKRITLKSRNGAEATVIDCEEKPETRGFSFQNDETIDSVLDGFTIKNGNHTFGGGIYCSYASPTIKNCVIDSNQARRNGSWTGLGGGIYIFNADPIITHCTIIRNEADYFYSGGICIDGEFFRDGVVLREKSAEPTIENCFITENTGGGIYAHSSVNPKINECTISKNSGRGIFYNIHARTSNPITNCRIEQNSGGGLEVREHSYLMIEKSIIFGNTAEYGGGILCSTTSVLVVSDCVIAHNTATKNGGGIKVTSSWGGTTVRNCTITQNTAHEKGGGVYALILLSGFELTDSIVWGNRSERTHAEVFASGRPIVIRFSDIKDGLDGIGQEADGVYYIYENNIDEDPMFVDADSGDFRLKPGSPAAAMGAQTFDIGLTAVSQYGRQLVRWADLKRK